MRHPRRGPCTYVSDLRTHVPASHLSLISNWLTNAALLYVSELSAPYVPVMAEASPAIVLFDGVCNLCNGSVQFVLDHERPHAPGSADQPLRFAALQSEAARKVLESALGPDEAARFRTGSAAGVEGSV